MSQNELPLAVVAAFTVIQVVIAVLAGLLLGMVVPL